MYLKLSPSSELQIWCTRHKRRTPRRERKTSAGDCIFERLNLLYRSNGSLTTLFPISFHPLVLSHYLSPRGFTLRSPESDRLDRLLLSSRIDWQLPVIIIRVNGINWFHCEFTFHWRLSNAFPPQKVDCNSDYTVDNNYTPGSTPDAPPNKEIYQPVEMFWISWLIKWFERTLQPIQRANGSASEVFCCEF